MFLEVLPGILTKKGGILEILEDDNGKGLSIKTRKYQNLGC